MVAISGGDALPLTAEGVSSSHARWSPDGRYISFLSSRQAPERGANEFLPVEGTKFKGSQIWLMDRRGGEGKRLTGTKGGVDDYAWSPDSKKILLTLTDPDPEDSSKIKTTKPYVIDRYQYKQDVQGYRYKKVHTHLYLFDLGTKKLDTLTKGGFDEGSAVWSPDGSAIAFVSNRTEDPDKNENSDIYIIQAQPGATMRQLTNWKGTDNNPRWSPDGQTIAYTRSVSDEVYHMYDEPVLCVIPAAGGTPKLLTRALDRPIFSPRWTKDGKSIVALVENDRRQYVASFPTDNSTASTMTMITNGARVFTSIESVGDQMLALGSDPQTPPEIYALDSGKDGRRLTHHTDEFLAPLELAKVVPFTSKSTDGTSVSGIYYRPPDAPEGKKLPLILFIHGGPVGQDALNFDLSRQILAGGGYLVAAVNYRGSSGRGLDFCKVIFADWGNKEVMDLHGAVDYLVKEGLADPDHLGVAGWSYGGILTDYLIASDTRFKAASSGAGTGFTLSLYGVAGKPGGGLVEQQEIRIEHQRPRDLDEAQLAVLQPVGADIGQRFQPDHAEQAARFVRQHAFVAVAARQ
jgi:dipeptidyl aminopeptidase/acylaminoacyl peptidase